MSACQKIAAALFRVAEAEASPEDALLVARHLDSCTVCRIVLARERRLGRALERLDDRGDDGEALTERIMTSLPAEPARPVAARRPRRGLKLAGAVIAVIGGGASLVGWCQLAPGGLTSVPGARLDWESASRILDGLGAVIRVAATALDGLGIARGAAAGGLANAGLVALPILSMAVLATGAVLVLGSSWLASRCRSSSAAPDTDPPSPLI